MHQTNESNVPNKNWHEFRLQLNKVVSVDEQSAVRWKNKRVFHRSFFDFEKRVNAIGLDSDHSSFLLAFESSIRTHSVVINAWAVIAVAELDSVAPLLLLP
jgi:hypothetical protein